MDGGRGGVFNCNQLEFWLVEGLGARAVPVRLMGRAEPGNGWEKRGGAAWKGTECQYNGAELEERGGRGANRNIY